MVVLHWQGELPQRFGLSALQVTLGSLSSIFWQGWMPHR